MFRKKSLRFKISIVILLIIIVMTAIGILLANHFLDRYYINGKENALVSVFEDIDSIYTEGLDTQNSDERLSSGTISDDLALQLDRFSLSNNMSVIIYREIQEHLYDYMMNTHTNLLLYTSLGDTQDSMAESNNIFRDYFISQQEAGSSDLLPGQKYVIQRVNVQRLGASYIYLQGQLQNSDKILIRVSIEGIRDSVNLAKRFYIYLMALIAIVIMIFLFFSTGHLLKPIEELTKQAGRMAELDFTARYKVKTDDEIGDLGRSINRMSESLEHALSELKSANAQLSRDLEKREQIDDMRKEFLSNISHELKTPIALIQGYAEGLQDNINEDEESRQFYCSVIIDEARKMNQMVSQIMALNELESGSGNLNMEYFDITELIRTILDKSSVLIHQAEADVIFDDSQKYYVWSDPFMAEEVFTNYLTNALHHTEGDRRIEISMQRFEDHVRIGVFNTGNQIPEEDLPRIWEKFYKVDKARSREYGGSGVGLSIVKAIMDLLGQHYGVQNMENGVLFWFDLDSRDTSGNTRV